MQVSTGEKRRTTLNREVQLKIGQQLRASYNEVLEQGVPSRFLDLMRRLDGEVARVAEQAARAEQDDKDAQK